MFRPIALWLVSAVLVVAGCESRSEPPTTETATAPAFLGTWMFDAGASDFSGLRVTFSGDPNGEMTLTWAGTGYTFRVDGKEYDSMGMRASWKQTGPRTWDAVYTSNGAVNNTDHLTLSVNGKELVIETDRVGPPSSHEKLELARATGEGGLIGEWRTKAAQMEGNGWTFSQPDADHIKVSLLPQNISAVVRPDGTPAALDAPPEVLPAGFTLALEMREPQSFRLTQRQNGAVIQDGTFTVSGDGGELVADVLSGPPGPAQDRVKLVYRKRS